MGLEMKVEVIHRETIKPSSPTPHHHKTTNLSAFDQLSPDLYNPLLLFYPNKTNANDINNHSEKSKILKRSLSETLAHFYPFAGKFEYNVSISCNDHGAAFLEAQVNLPMSKILEKPDVGILKQLIPTGLGSRPADTGYLVLVQANFFECGGLVIGLSISHTITDACSLSPFLQAWAAIALHGSTDPAQSHHLVVPSGRFDLGASLFPPLEFLNSSKPSFEFSQEKCITKRFVFDASNIAALKSRAASATVPNPTRVEVVSGLIWKCAMQASRSNLGVVRPSKWSPVVNMRKVLVKQPLAETAMGNLVGYYGVRIEASEVVDVDVQSLVAKLRKGFEEFREKYGNGVSGEEACEIFREFRHIMKRDVNNYNCSSLCRFPFYETNFGWGKPLWVCETIEMKNLFVLMDTRDGHGIEAFLTFNEQDMAAFESNKELLAYASVNPNIRAGPGDMQVVPPQRASRL